MIDAAIDELRAPTDYRIDQQVQRMRFDAECRTRCAPFSPLMEKLRRLGLGKNATIRQ